jgi:hypothetical protein
MQHITFCQEQFLIAFKKQKAVWFISTRLFDLADGAGLHPGHHFAFSCAALAFGSALFTVVILEHPALLRAFIANCFAQFTQIHCMASIHRHK